MIIHRFINEEILKTSEIIGKGFMNRTFLVETVAAKYIIRAREEDTFSEYRKEKWCMEQAEKLGIPTPQVLHIGKSESLSFMVETYIDGINGLDIDIPEEVWFYIGEYARKLHSIPISGFGSELADEHDGVFASHFNPTLTQLVDYNIEQLTSDDYLGIFTESNLIDILKIFDYIKQCNYEIGFNHGDLSRKNTLVSKNNIVTLLDYGCAVAHAVPFFDLSYIFGETVKGREPSDSMIQSFIDGYGITRGELNSMKKDIYSVMLLNAFDKVRWAFDHHDTEIEYYASYANKVLAKTLIFFK
jgi:aminoglycoside phosphotransferase (APT) family kinase protein